MSRLEVEQVFSSKHSTRKDSEMFFKQRLNECRKETEGRNDDNKRTQKREEKRKQDKKKSS